LKLPQTRLYGKFEDYFRVAGDNVPDIWSRSRHGASKIESDRHENTLRADQRRRMGRINIAGWALFIGAVGQALLLGHLTDRVPSWLVFVPLSGPWLLVYVISFCRVAPCGPHRFAQLLVIAMTWYSFNTFMCELVWLFHPTGRSRMYGAAIPHALCYGSAVSFIVLVRAVRDARNYRVTHLGSV
jgi:hypothetical protein